MAFAKDKSPMIRFMSASSVRVVACGVLLSLTACQKSSTAEPKASGQEVARIGSDPITTSELQFELRSTSQHAPSEQDTAAALQRIAARKSLAQKAIAAGLDRQPGILLELRKAREQILANAAAVSDIKKEEQKITLESVNAYIAAHPLQFADRQILLVEELLVSSKNDIDKIVAAVKSDTSADEIEKYFVDNKIPFDKKQVELDTKTLPEALGRALLKSNNIPVVGTPPASIFMQVKQSKAVPITGTDADKAAREQMIRTLYEKEMSAPSAGDDVTYLPPYKDIIEKTKAATNK